jgi:hypothetical protein
MEKPGLKTSPKVNRGLINDISPEYIKKDNK